MGNTRMETTSNDIGKLGKGVICSVPSLLQSACPLVLGAD